MEKTFIRALGSVWILGAATLLTATQAVGAVLYGVGWSPGSMYQQVVTIDTESGAVSEPRTVFWGTQPSDLFGDRYTYDSSGRAIAVRPGEYFRTNSLLVIEGVASGTPVVDFGRGLLRDPSTPYVGGVDDTFFELGWITYLEDAIAYNRLAPGPDGYIWGFDQGGQDEDFPGPVNRLFQIPTSGNATNVLVKQMQVGFNDDDFRFPDLNNYLGFAAGPDGTLFGVARQAGEETPINRLYRVDPGVAGYNRLLRTMVYQGASGVEFDTLNYAAFAPGEDGNLFGIAYTAEGNILVTIPGTTGGVNTSIPLRRSAPCPEGPCEAEFIFPDNFVYQTLIPAQIVPVPLPPAAGLFVGGLGLLGFLRRARTGVSPRA